MILAFWRPARWRPGCFSHCFLAEVLSARLTDLLPLVVRQVLLRHRCHADGAHLDAGLRRYRFDGGRGRRGFLWGYGCLFGRRLRGLADIHPTAGAYLAAIAQFCPTATATFGGGGHNSPPEYSLHRLQCLRSHAQAGCPDEYEAPDLTALGTEMLAHEPDGLKIDALPTLPPLDKQA